MIPDEMERTMQFILEHQAKFEVDMAETRQAIAETRRAIAETQRGISDLNDTATGLLQISRTLIDSRIAAEGRMATVDERWNEKMAEWAEAGGRAEGRISRLDQAMVELAEAGRRTDERLDAFIAFVEKYISSRNGGERTH